MNRSKSDKFLLQCPYLTTRKGHCDVCTDFSHRDLSLNDHPLFDFQLNRVVMWNHGDPAEIQARGGEITDFPSWERV